MIRFIFKYFLIITIAILEIRFGQDFEIHKVIEVLDGDTIILENGDHVRYIGVDTPEIHHPNKPVECYGVEAYIRNRDLVLNKYVILERDVEDFDQYNRPLRYVYSINGFINGKLIEEGYGYSYYYPPNLKYHKLFMDLEIEAMNNFRGLWKVCNF